MASNDERCSVFERKVNRSNSFFCQTCSNFSHIKSNGIESKSHKSLWICLNCRSEIFPFSKQDSNSNQNDSDLSNLKSYFEQLNSLDSQNETGETDILNINCKYFDCAEFSSIPFKSKTLSFFHINISSLDKHFCDLSTLFSRLDHEFDILGITETRLKPHSTSNVSLPGYSFLSTPTTSFAGGTGLYVSHKLSYKPREDLTKILVLNSLIESTFIEIILKNKKNIIVGCVYKHPLMSVDDFNDHYINPLLSKIVKEKKSILLLGDFNIDLLKCNSNSSYSNFLDLMGSFNLLPTITLPTRITTSTSTLIDNIFLSSTTYDTISGNLTVNLSDHLPQFLLLFINPEPKSKTKLGYYRKWKSFNSNSFSREFSNIDWNEVLAVEKGDINHSFNAFINEYSSLFDKHVPLVKLTRKQEKLFAKPWITKGILTSVRVRDKLFKDYLNTSDLDLKSYLHQSYKLYRNRIVSLLRLSKKIHYSNYFILNTANMKKIWIGVRELISSKSTKASSGISLQTENGKLTSDPSEVTECFNKFFTNIADKIRSTIPPSKNHFSKWLSNPNPNSFFLNPTTPHETANVIRSLSRNKATGPCSIPYDIFECCSDSISNILSKLINLSFSTGVFPSKLKEAKVIPIFKKGSPIIPENYRPISLLSNIDKIFQKIVHKRLMSFLERNNILYPFQFGFRSKHSTANALIYSIENIFKALDSGNFGCFVFIDLQKAFDTVDHCILLSKLKHYGIRGLPLSWFNSFLSYRKQFVSISGVSSKSQLINHGVPQGSVLGPLLFLIYINDLHYAIPYSSVNLFADDTMIFYSDKSAKSLTKRINIDLKCLVDWLNSNKISLNSTKTELLIFHPKRRPINYDVKIKINGKRIFPSESVKYLGVYIDKNLNWNVHVNYVCDKLKRCNGALCKLRHYVPQNTLLSLYYSLFDSHISYCPQIWAQTQNSNTNRILVLQKRALRIITFSDFNSPSSPLFLRFHLINFIDSVKLLNIIFVYNVLNSSLPHSITNIFDFSFNIRDRHNPRLKQGSLKLPYCSTVSFGNRSIYYQSVLAWNLLQNFLPIENLSLISLSRLKYLCKFYFLSSYSSFSNS